MWLFDLIIIICLLAVIGNLYEIKVLLKDKKEKVKGASRDLKRSWNGN